MSKNSEFTGTEIPAVNTKHNRAPMQVGGMPFGRFGANKKVNNNASGIITGEHSYSDTINGEKYFLHTIVKKVFYELFFTQFCIHEQDHNANSR